jgi:hypothetical protein
MHKCESSLIGAYGFDKDTLDLDITFRSGPTWRYSGVPVDTFLAFLRSPSKGKYLNANIKGKFKEEKQ